MVAYTPGQVPNEHDPVGHLTTTDREVLFRETALFESDQGSVNGYSEVIFRRSS